MLLVLQLQGFRYYTTIREEWIIVCLTLTNVAMSLILSNTIDMNVGRTATALYTQILILANEEGRMGRIIRQVNCSVSDKFLIFIIFRLFCCAYVTGFRFHNQLKNSHIVVYDNDYKSWNVG